MFRDRIKLEVLKLVNSSGKSFDNCLFRSIRQSFISIRQAEMMQKSCES
jgi:hypothetical protein